MALLSLVQEARSVALAWDSPADPSVVRLRVYYGTSSGSYNQHMTWGTQR
jgi:hypothetical protein